MIRRLQSIQRACGESGSALVIALLFISLFGLLIAVQTSWGGTSQQVDRTVVKVRDAQYGADGALQGAIARYKADPSACVADGDPHDFFTYQAPVGKAPETLVDYTVQCEQDPPPSTGGSATPPTDFCPTSATGSDFVPVNSSQTNATLAETLRYMEQPSQGQPGHVAVTHYAHTGNNTVQLGSYVPCDTSLTAIPDGASFQKVDLRVSHSETTAGSGQTQSVKLVTATCPGAGQTYTVAVAKPAGGPSWPAPSYETLDVSNCIKNSADVTGAVVTYQAQAPCAPSCGTASDVLDGAVIAVRLKSTPTSSPSVNNTKPNLLFVTPFGTCGTPINNWGTRKVQWSPTGTCQNPPATGVSTEANCAGSSTCPGGNSTNPASYSQALFCGNCSPNTVAVGDSTGILFSGFNWPTEAPIVNVVLRVVHLEPWANFEPSVTITTPNGTCTLNKTSSPALLTSGRPIGQAQNATFREDALVLPAACSPLTAADMAGTTVLYTLTCASAGGQGGTKCGTGGTTSPTNYLDTVLFDFNYVSGTGPLTGGGTNPNSVTFAALLGGETKGTATYDPTDASIDTWNVDG